MRSALRPLLDHPFEHRDREGDTRRLERLEIDGGEKPGPPRIPPLAIGIGENVLQPTDTLTRCSPCRSCRIGCLAEIAHGRECAGDIDGFASLEPDDRRPLDIGPPDAADKRRLVEIGRQSSAGAESVGERCHGREIRLPGAPT
jgi:hypothetical protein